MSFNNVFLDIESLIERLFFLLAPSLFHPTVFWPHIVSSEKSTINFIEAPLYVSSHFSLATFKILSLCFNNLIMMHPVYLSLFYLEFVELFGCTGECFSKTGHFFSHYFLRCSFCSFVSPLFFWDSCYANVDRLDGGPQVSEALFDFLPFAKTEWSQFWELYTTLIDISTPSLSPKHFWLV